MRFGRSRPLSRASAWALAWADDLSRMLLTVVSRGDTKSGAELVRDFATRLRRRPPSSDDHQVDILRHPVARGSEPLANAAFDAIPHHRVPHGTAHRQPKATISGHAEGPAMRRTRGRYGDEEIARTMGLALVAKTLEIARTQQPIRRPKATGPRRLHCYFDPTETESEWRPFARLRFRIARPARVLIRLRKPCLRFLLIRLG
jgi:hypothetical protein